ncbi:MAG: hypothetical protein A3J38_04115 [Gammaproteobacteria bacterium RIFCSPHIGHO2_12_FULL_45_9]|nr:MAG: hypothetical protein A3J38_04115 [Gammaproteobacteria bacterium RIFCSPHIGHO2_12_FULL_45_9]
MDLRQNKWRFLFLLVLSFSCFNGLAFAQSTPQSVKPTNPQDPYESVNRKIFNFNDALDRAILKPVATFYNKVMPRPLNRGVHNFFNNIWNVTTLVNDLLQIRFQQAASDAWRLTINTTVGIAGFFDVASYMGLQQSYNDFGLTLARIGYVNSNYIVVPFFGAGTIRDVAGWPVDYFLFSVYPYVRPLEVQYGIYALNVVDRRAHYLQYDEVMREAALDKYAFVRSAYLQRRAHLIELQKQGLADNNGYGGAENSSE